MSLIDIAVEALSNAFAEHRLLGRTPSRRGNGQPNAVPAAEVVRTADGMVVVSAYTQDHFARLCRAIGRPELISTPIEIRASNGEIRSRPAKVAAMSRPRFKMRSARGRV